MPVLDISVGGNSPSSIKGQREYGFNLVNAGKQCIRVALYDEVRGDLASPDLLATGGRLGFSLTLPVEGAVVVAVKVTYLDSRSDPGEKAFLIQRAQGRFGVLPVLAPAKDAPRAG